MNRCRNGEDCSKNFETAAVEMERTKFEKRFLEILDIWNLPKKEEKQ